MFRIRTLTLLWVALAVILPGLAAAQTTTAPGIDVELYNAADGGFRFCVAPGSTMWANVWVRPGADMTSCTAACSPPNVAGGSANLATGVINVGFEPTHLYFVQAESNPDPGFAAVDGLIQDQNVGAGQIGWALSGDWAVNGDPMSALANVCDMAKLDTEGWVFRTELAGGTPGLTTLRLLGEADAPPFALSFADACGTPAFTESSGIDEVGHGVVLVSPECGSGGVIFFDTYERGNFSAWSQVVQ